MQLVYIVKKLLNKKSKVNFSQSGIVIFIYACVYMYIALRCYLEIHYILKAFDFLWYKSPDLWAKKCYTFCTVEDSID